MTGVLRPDQFLPNLSKRFVYGIQSGQFIKVGVAMDIAKRLNTMRLSNPHPLKVVFRRQIHAAYHCERMMHEILKPKAIGREWFDVTIEEVRAAATIGTAIALKVWRAEVCKSIPLTRQRHSEDSTNENHKHLQQLPEIGHLLLQEVTKK